MRRWSRCRIPNFLMYRLPVYPVMHPVAIGGRVFEWPWTLSPLEFASRTGEFCIKSLLLVEQFSLSRIDVDAGLHPHPKIKRICFNPIAEDHTVLWHQ